MSNLLSGKVSFDARRWPANSAMRIPTSTGSQSITWCISTEPLGVPVRLLLVVVVASGADLELDAGQHLLRPSPHRALGMIFQRFQRRLIEREVGRERTHPAEAMHILLDVLEDIVPV